MILISIILVGGAFLFAEYRNKNGKEVYIKNDVSLEKTSTSSLKYSDNNTDWKKVLLTNEMFGSTTITDLTKKAEKLEQIDSVSRQFFAQYMELRQMGNSGVKLSQQELIDKTIGNITFSSPVDYTLNKIVTKKDSTFDSIKKYGNDVGDIFNKYSVKSRNEGVIVRDYQLKDDESVLNELDPIIKSYKNIINALLKLETPLELNKIHLDIINSTNKCLFIAELFKKAAVDPLSGLQAASQYKTVSSGLFSSVVALKTYLLSQNIKYLPNEGGYIFTKQQI